MKVTWRKYLFDLRRLAGTILEENICHQLSSPKNSLAEGIYTYGDPPVIRAGTPGGRSSDIMGRPW